MPHVEVSAWPKNIIERLENTTADSWQSPDLKHLVGAATEITPEIFFRVAKYLANQQTLSIKTEPRRIDITDETITITRAADTPAWPMGTHLWIRDMTLIAQRLLTAGHLQSNQEHRDLGRQLLLSALSLMSTPPQLKRFEDIVDGQSDPASAHNWPHIFLDSTHNASGHKQELWSHKQEAWQMTAAITLEAIEEGFIDETDLKIAHRQFISLCAPFLAKIQYWRNPSSGSWEEIEAVRSSVIAWEVNLLKKLNEDELASQGMDVIEQQLPLESPAYAPADTRYREADAALMYVLQLGLAQDRSAAVLDQIKTLIDPLTGAMIRYKQDSYQRSDFFRPDVARDLQAYYGSTSGEVSSIANFKARDRIVPKGREAAWVHPIWQLSAFYGRRYIATKRPEDKNQQHQYFLNGLRLITSQQAATVEPSFNGAIQLKEIMSARIPECYITLRLPDREIIVPSPHTPLNWAVAEAIDAFAVMKASFNISTDLSPV